MGDLPCAMAYRAHVRIDDRIMLKAMTQNLFWLLAFLFLASVVGMLGLLLLYYFDFL